MNERSRVLLLITILTATALIAGGITLTLLYQTALDEERARLVETVQSQARLLEAVARFDAAYSLDYPGGAAAATLSQMRDAHKNYAGFGKTGEFTLAKREGDQMVFLLSHRHHDLDLPRPVPFDSELAEPMRRSLSGQSGTVVGLDYRGEVVLAAYEPVVELGLGIVAKIDMAEIRAPFVTAGKVAGIATVTVVVLGVLLFLRISNPVLRNLRESEERYRTLFERVPVGLYRTSVKGEILDVNPAIMEMLGYRDRESLLGVNAVDVYANADDRARWQALMDQEGAVRDFEAQWRRSDGTVIWVRDNARAVRDVKGQIQYNEGSLEDIAERVRAESQREVLLEALWQERDTAQKYLDIAKVMFVALNAKGEVTLINRKGSEILGYEQEEIIGKNWFDNFLPVSMNDRVKTVFHRLMAGKIEPVEYYENPVLTKGGEERIIAWHNTVLKDDEGSIIGTLGSGEDISERLRSEEALQESHRQLATLMSSLPGMAYRCKNDPDWTMEFISGGCQSLTGHSPEDLVGNALLSYAEIIHPEDRHMAGDIVQDALEDKRAFQLTYRITTASGEEKWVWEQGQGIFGAQDDVIALEGFITDITERKQMEGTLRESEERYRTLFERVPVGLYRTTVKGKVLDVNPAVIEMLGYPDRESLLGVNAVDVYANADDRARWQALMDQEGVVRDFEAQWRRSDGTVIWVRDNARAVRDVKGQIQYNEGSLEDIAERVVAEEALRERVKELTCFHNVHRDLQERLPVDEMCRRVVEYLIPAMRFPEITVPLIELDGQRFTSGEYSEHLSHCLWAPIEASGQVRGKLWIYYTKDRPFLIPEEQTLISTVAGSLGLWLDHRQAEEGREGRLRQLAVLNHVSHAVTSSLHLGQVLAEIVSLTDRVVPNDLASIALVDQGGRIGRGAESVPLELVIDYRIRDEGVTSWIVRSRKPVVVDKVSADGAVSPDLGEGAPRFANPEVVALGIKSFVGLPLVAKEHPLGVLYLHSRHPGAFRAQMPVLTILADQAAIAIENARLYADAQQRTEELIALNEAGQAVVSTLDVEQVLLTSIQQAIKVLNVEACSILLLNAESGELEFVAASGAGADDLKGRRLPPDVGVAGWVVQNEQPAIVPDVEDDPRFFSEVDASTGFVTRSVLAVPLRVKGQIIGVMEALNKLKDRFGAADLRLLQSLASSAAIATEHARLYEQAHGEIRERVQAEKKLEHSLSLLRATLDSTGDGVAALDRQGIMTTFNQRVVDMWQIPASMIASQDDDRAIAFVCDQLKDPDSFLDQVQRLSGEPHAASFDILELQDGRVFEAFSRPQQVGGESIGRVWSFHDITERVQAEEALQAERDGLERRVQERTEELSITNAELARASRMKDEFLASMSHELRTPLNAILGMSEGLQEEIYGSLNEKQLKSLRTIEASGHHLLSLINDILDVSKIEAGKMELELCPTSVEAVCQASLGLIKQQAHKKKLRVDSSFDSRVTTIQADGRRLKQILVNLLSNAVKFTPEGGAIGLDVVGDEERGSVDLTVWDTGIGISQEDMERLFQPFVQLDSSLSREHEGTGLGLALVQRLADLHRGGVSLESQVGEGSRFTVALPWQGSREQIELRAEAESPRGAVTLRRALIVEDEAAALEQLARYLAELDAETVVHPCGEGAVEKALEVEPDVIILDILLPDLSGWEVLAQLKAEPRTREIPVVIVSVVDDRTRGLALGAVEHLVKPISRQQLRLALSRVLPPEVAALEEAAGPEAEHPLVLLTEDREDNINTIFTYLLARGYRVIVARNGVEAIERAREERPDVVLMDIQMPGMDGLEAIRRIRAETDASTGQKTSLADVPIIALTALAMPNDRERCLAAGADEYLSKPVSLKGLVRVIEEQLKWKHR